jgi:branched-chain amino acid transport system ATP-binding protein
MRIGARLLEAERLAKNYDGVAAVRDVSFTVDAGEIVALIGPNGAGKSTCFNMLSGQNAPSAGVIRILGRDTTHMAPKTIWRLGVGRTFQITATFGSMSVRENVAVAILSHRGKTWSLVGARDAAVADAADSLLDLVGMRDAARRPSSELAYGDLKRLELAIALANEPKLLLMDEPTAGMAPRERIDLMRLTADITRERAIGVLFTEHDMDVVFEHADRVMVMDRGRIIAQGSPADVRADAQVRAVYLGEGSLYDARYADSSH